jgi:hypothetical protein
MSVRSAFIVAAFLAAAWLATIEPSRVVISGDDIVPLKVERPAPRYSSPVAAIYTGLASSSTAASGPTVICATTAGTTGSTTAYRTTAVVAQ